MELDEIKEVIDKYGVDQILEDHNLSWALVFQILNECRYLDLEEYLDD